VGGTGLTEIVSIYPTGSEFDPASAIFIAKIPTGTTGDVVVTFTGVGGGNCAVSLYRIIPQFTTISTHATDSDFITVNNDTTVLSTPLATLSGAAVLATSQQRNGLVTSNPVLVEDVDIDINTGEFFGCYSGLAVEQTTNCEITTSDGSILANEFCGVSAAFVSP